MMLSQTISKDLSSSGQMAFLRRITQDDGFRSALEADPQAALAEYGLHVDPNEIPSEVTLPNRPEILGRLSCFENSGDDESMQQMKWFGFLGQ